MHCAAPPQRSRNVRAWRYALGALNAQGELTKQGRRMAEFPMDPALSKAIVTARGAASREAGPNVGDALPLAGSQILHIQGKAAYNGTGIEQNGAY